MSHRAFKDRIYAQFARVSAALASDRRLELIDLLAQAPRHVEALAAETEMSVANTSQHLQALKAARLVETERNGNRMVYRLADASVARLWFALRQVAEERLSELTEINRSLGREENDSLSRDELERLVERGEILLIDVRPLAEFEYGHLPNAIPLPLEELDKGIDQLPRDRQIVAYCRGDYCLFADEAVQFLRARGFDALRLDGGWLEWLAGSSDSTEA